MADETNLNGLLGYGDSGSSGVLGKFAKKMGSNVWEPAKAASAAIRADWAAIEAHAKNVARYATAGASGVSGIRPSSMGLGTGKRTMTEATFGTSSSPVILDKKMLPAAKFTGTDTTQVVSKAPGTSSMTGRVMGGAVFGAIAAYGASIKGDTYTRDLMAQQFASMQAGTTAKQFYNGKIAFSGGMRFGSGLGSTSVTDMVQGQAAVANMGFLAGSKQFGGYMQQLQQGAMQTGMGYAGFANVMSNLQSGQVGNSSRAMLGVNIRNSDGSTKNVNQIALQLMKAMHSGTVGNAKDTALSLRQGGNLDQALEQLGLDPATKAAVAASMRAQAVGGGGLGQLNTGKATGSALKLTASQENRDAQNTASAVSALVRSNDLSADANDMLAKIFHALNGALGGIGIYFDKFLPIMLALGGKLGIKAATSVVKTVARTVVRTLPFVAKKAMGLLPDGLGEGVAAPVAGVAAVGAAGGLLGSAYWEAHKNGPANEMPGEQPVNNLNERVKLQKEALQEGAHHWANSSDPGYRAAYRNEMRAGWFTGSDGAMANPGGGGGGGAVSSSGMSGAVAIAMQYIGQPYVWGGQEPGGFDCSGLTKYVYAKLGVNLPHHAADQARMGSPVDSLAAALPGDLLFWGVPAHHVAIYIGNGKMIAAPHTGANVQVQNVYGNPYIRRVLGNNQTLGGKNTNSLAQGQGSSGGPGAASMMGGASSPLVTSSSSGITGSQMSAADLVAANLSTSLGSSSGGGTTGVGTGGSVMPNSAPSVGAAPGNPSGNQKLAQQMAAAMGWSGDEWNALYAVWNQESGFKANAGRPGAAYGIPQADPGNKMASSGSDWMTNPKTQIEWGLKYIKNRYKDPLGALAHKHATDTNLGATGDRYDQPGGYYAQGAFEVQRDQYARVHKGEAILPADGTAQSYRNSAAGKSNGGGSMYVTINTMTIDDATIQRFISLTKQATGFDVIVDGLMNN